MLDRKRRKFVSPPPNEPQPVRASRQEIEEFLKSLESYKRDDLQEESEDSDSSKN